MAAVAVLLAGCGSSAEPTIPGRDLATVTGAGRQVQIPAGIGRGDYPDLCRLLPADTVATLLGAPATSGSNVSGCAWTTGLAAFPSLQVSWIELGSNAADRYDQSVGTVSAERSLSGIGRQARIYRLESDRNENKTIRVDVLKDRAFFRVEVRLVTTSSNDIAANEQVAIRVARLIAAQVG